MIGRLKFRREVLFPRESVTDFENGWREIVVEKDVRGENEVHEKDKMKLMGSRIGVRGSEG